MGSEAYAGSTQLSGGPWTVETVHNCPGYAEWLEKLKQGVEDLPVGMANTPYPDANDLKVMNDWKPIGGDVSRRVSGTSVASVGEKRVLRQSTDGDNRPQKKVISDADVTKADLKSREAFQKFVDAAKAMPNPAYYLLEHQAWLAQTFPEFYDGAAIDGTLDGTLDGTAGDGLDYA